MQTDTFKRSAPGRANLRVAAGWKPALRLCVLWLPFLVFAPLKAAAEDKPVVRFAIVGLAHDHAGGFIPRAQGRQDISLAGIVESKPDLIRRYSARFGLKP